MVFPYCFHFGFLEIGEEIIRSKNENKKLVAKISLSDCFQTKSVRIE
jgi:hypothetical protein